jgi:hypothetical protein
VSSFLSKEEVWFITILMAPRSRLIMAMGYARAVLITQEGYVMEAPITRADFVMGDLIMGMVDAALND